MKIKSNRSALKRLKITSTKKLLRRPTKQNHFNVKEKSKKTRSKRKSKEISLANEKSIRKLIPYNL